MPLIELRNVSKNICQDVSLKILNGELLVLLGPSGAGKTTLLNLIAGLTDYKGSIIFDGVPVNTVSADKRELGYVFQDCVLFPHLDVTGNIAYSMKVRNFPQNKVALRVEELLQIMKITHLSSRYPKHLSGGEKQRVALARALALSPRVLLLDEPMSSLDLQTAKYLRVGLKQLQREIGVTTIYVTHDLEEAQELADRIAVIHKGRVVQVGVPEEGFFHPANEVVSDFVGAPNILECESCQELEHGVIEVSCGGLPIIIAHEGNAVERIALFPRDIYVSRTRPPGPGVNRFTGTITDIKFTEGIVRLEIKAGRNKLVAEMPQHIFEGMELEVGKEVFLIFKLRRIRAYQGKKL